MSIIGCLLACLPQRRFLYHLRQLKLCLKRTQRSQARVLEFIMAIRGMADAITGIVITQGVITTTITAIRTIEVITVPITGIVMTDIQGVAAEFTSASNSR